MSTNTFTLTQQVLKAFRARNAHATACARAEARFAARRTISALRLGRYTTMVEA